jgi:hypothetical protein
MRILVLAALLLAFAPAARAHEFWLSPEAWTVAPGDSLVVRLRVGETFKGPSYIYNPARFARFEVIAGGQARPVEGRVGDDPALAAPAPAEGLAIVVHETTDSQLIWTEWEKFRGFVAHKDFPGVLEAHAARGLPQTGFRETYRRYAKALVAVGDGAGADRAVGLETEIVALANPYADDLSAGLPLRVLRAGAPRADAQLELFDRAPDGSVSVTLHRTDADGRVTVPVTPGHEYLADAVMLDAIGTDDPAAGPVWQSLWASLTFAVPKK